MAATHCHEPREAIVAGLDSGRGERYINCQTSVLLQWSERLSDAVRWAEVSEMEREIKRWQEGDKGALRSTEGEKNRSTASIGRKKYQHVIKELWFIWRGQSDGDPMGHVWSCQAVRTVTSAQSDPWLSLFLHFKFWENTERKNKQTMRRSVIKCCCGNTPDKCPQGERQHWKSIRI